MSLTLGSNIAALTAQRRLGDTTSQLGRVFERLASGMRINRASDDAAGLAISENLRTDARVYNQGVRNLNDGISLLNVADAALEELTNIVVRLEELATQAVNGSYSDTQREVLDLEAQALSEEFFRIINSTEFNDINLLNGDLQELFLQAGFGIDAALGTTLGGALGTGGILSANFLNSGFFQAESGDIDGDGNVDLVVSTASGSQIYLGDGNGGFQDGELIGSSSHNYAQLEDINNDGRLDYIAATGTSMEVFLGNGDGTFNSALTTTLTYSSSDLQLGDFNGDGITDVVVGSSLHAEILLGAGDGTFTITSEIVDAAADFLTVGDYNGDGIDDIATAQLGVNYHLSNGDGTFTLGGALNGVDSFNDIQTADLNGDGVLDLFAVNTTDDAISVFLGADGGGFQSETQYSTENNSKRVQAGDLDGDGVLDLVVADSGGSVGVLLGNGDGSFGDISTYSNGAVLLGEVDLNDFNNDGVLDVVAGGITIALHLGETENGVAPLLDFSLGTKSDASQALSIFKNKLDLLTEQRGHLGAFQSRIGFASNHLQATSENYLAAAQRIVEADIAFEAAEMVRLQILQQAGAAILSQANLQPNLVLKLLEN